MRSATREPPHRTCGLARLLDLHGVSSRKREIAAGQKIGDAHRWPVSIGLEAMMIPIEQYADLCALMANTGGDVTQENAIAAQHGVSPEAWAASKAGWTAKMSDPNDMGRTAMAFMPLYQAAQARARGGKEPCTLAFYAKVHAEMAWTKDALGNQ